MHLWKQLSCLFYIFIFKVTDWQNRNKIREISLFNPLIKTNSLLDQLKQLIDSLINTEHLSMSCLIVYAHAEFKMSKQNKNPSHSQSHRSQRKTPTVFIRWRHKIENFYFLFLFFISKDNSRQTPKTKATNMFKWMYNFH